MKNKTIIPFNYKMVILLVADLILLFLTILLCFQHLKNEYWIIVMFCFFGMLIYILGFSVFLLKNIKFKETYILIPKEYGRLGEAQTESKIFYNNIESVKLIKSKEEGPHLQGVFNKLDSIVFTGKDGKIFMFSANYCSKKQIKTIIEETKKRANLL